MDGPLKALAQLREGLERALAFIRAHRKTAAKIEPKVRAQLIEWEQRLEGLLGETVAAARSGLAATPMVAGGLLSRTGQALHGFTQFAQQSLGAIGQRAVEGAKEGVQEGAKLAIRGAKGAGSLAEGLKDLANEAIEGAVEGAKEGAKGALKGLKKAAAAVPGVETGSTAAGAGGGGASATGRSSQTESTDQWAPPPNVPLGEPIPIGGHVLPPLPYAYNALEPHIDEQTMRLHHDKHHQSYVDGLNKAEKALAEARRTGDFSLIKHWERELAFHGAGHYLHSLFWKTMAPHGGGKPTGELARLIDRDFGSFDAFQAQFSKAAEEVEGGGWAILVWAPRSRRLQILQAEKHQNLSQQDVIPLLPLDVWEHSYYLKYQNRRGEYIQHWWNVVNWPMVAKRLVGAVQVQWPPA